MDFASGGKHACGCRQTAEIEAGGEELPFRAYGKDFLQPREERLSGAGRGVGVDRVGEDPLSLFVRVASRTDGILVPMRKDSHGHENGAPAGAKMSVSLRFIVMDKIRVVWYNMRHETQAIYAH